MEVKIEQEEISEELMDTQIRFLNYFEYLNNKYYNSKLELHSLIFSKKGIKKICDLNGLKEERFGIYLPQYKTIVLDENYDFGNQCHNFCHELTHLIIQHMKYPDGDHDHLFHDIMDALIYRLYYYIKNENPI